MLKTLRRGSISHSTNSVSANHFLQYCSDLCTHFVFAASTHIPMSVLVSSPFPIASEIERNSLEDDLDEWDDLTEE